MSRLIRALRKRTSDTQHVEVPSTTKKTTKRKKETIANTISDQQFARILETYVSNKEAIKNLDNANVGYYTDLVEYTKRHGAKDGKGNFTTRVGNIVSLIITTTPRQLNIDKVERFIQKLVKRSHLSKKEAKKVVYAEYTLKLTQDQYKRLEKYLNEEAVIVDRQLKVDEQELEMLIPKGVATVDEIAKCYDELPEKTQFRPSRVKE